MSERRRALIVDAFAEEPLAGNPAGVVPDADDLAGGQMRAIAREINASETAFVLEADEADRRIRYFTPETEVDLCGHATIATHSHLFADGAIEAGTHTLATEVGVLDIEVEEDGTVWMTQNAPEVREIDLDPRRVADALGIDAGAIVDDLPIAWASTGLPYVVVPIEFLENLGRADPDGDAIEGIAGEFDATGVYAFTFDTLDGESTLHARMFAPGAGIPEDPVTGTASGAAGGYLRHVGAFDEMPDEMVFEQGHYVDRPGRVRVRVGTEVRVGGSAVEALDGEIRVPEREEDEIIEA
ncbi:MAG: PhzF family phenazine biosynthesis protein [Haloarculaceae archaeon]